MFKGYNTVRLSNETVRAAIEEYLDSRFGGAGDIRVTGYNADGNGGPIDFYVTTDPAPVEPAKAAPEACKIVASHFEF